MRFEVPAQHGAPTPPTAQKAKRQRKLKFPKVRMSSSAVIVASCALVIVTLAGLSGFLYWQNNKLKNNPASNTQAAADRIVSEVKKVYAVPTNETPTVATIKDLKALKDQPFFNGAQNGDAVLVYTKAKIAILFREKEHRVIKTGPVSTEAEQQQQQSASNGGSQNTSAGNGTQTLGAETKTP
jgi:hypothetical protein